MAAAAARPFSSHSGGGGDEANSSGAGGGRSSEQGTHDAGTHTGHAGASRGALNPAPAPAPAAPPRPGYVACPICGISTRAAFVNAHLDSCISRQGQQQENVQPSTRGARPSTQKPATQTPAIKPKRGADASHQHAAGREVRAALKPGSGGAAAAAVPLAAPAIEVPPKLVFNLISDKDLRKRMQALGLPLDGKKQVRQGKGL